MKLPRLALEVDPIIQSWPGTDPVVRGVRA
jgi:hypothetical protein